MQSKGEQIKLGAAFSYLSIILNIAAGLIYTPWMVQMIGQSQYGLYTLANSLISIFLVDFGLSSAVARYVSKYRSEGQHEKVNNFLGVIYKLYIVIDAVIFVVLGILFVFIGAIYKNLTPTEISQFKIVYLIAGFFSVVNFPFITLNGILTAYEEFVHLKLSEVVYRLLLVSIMIVVLLSGGGLYALVVVNAGVGLVVTVYKLLVIKKKIPIKINFRYKDATLNKELFGFSAWTTVSALAQRLVFSITPSVLGIVSNSAAIAMFGIVSTIEGYVFTFTTAINGMFMPMISRAYQKEDANEELFPLFLGVGKFQYALNGLIIAGFIGIGQQFVNLWMGPGYESTYYGILLTIIPGLFYNALQIANTALIVKNKVKYQAIINLTMGIANILLGFPLAMKLGMIGACISIFVAFMIRNIILNIVCHRVLGFDMKKLITECYLRMSIPIGITAVVACLANQMVPQAGWLDMIVRGAIVVVVFGLSVYTTGLKKAERTQVKQFLKRR